MGYPLTCCGFIQGHSALSLTDSAHRKPQLGETPVIWRLRKPHSLLSCTSPPIAAHPHPLPSSIFQHAYNRSQVTQWHKHAVQRNMTMHCAPVAEWFDNSANLGLLMATLCLSPNQRQRPLRLPHQTLPPRSQKHSYLTGFDGATI